MSVFLYSISEDWGISHDNFFQKCGTCPKNRNIQGEMSVHGYVKSMKNTVNVCKVQHIEASKNNDSIV